MRTRLLHRWSRQCISLSVLNDGCLLWKHNRLKWQRRTINTSNAGQPISPTLLARARSISEEHSLLTRQLADAYDANTAKRMGELAVTAARLKDYDQSQENLEELASMYGEDKEVNAMVDEEKQEVSLQIHEAGQALLLSLIPVHPFAHLPCLLEIRPGAGGDEAAIFAGDLLRMYQAFCARHGMSTTLLKCEEDNGVGTSSGSLQYVQEAILEVDHPDAYGLFRSEAGVHRVQRVPATESKGRTHTSAASVLVLPSLPSEGDANDTDFNNPQSDYYIDVKEVRTDIMRASGAGGQHVNKTESAVRLTHLPTGTTVFMQEFRSQPKNKEKAWLLLRSRLAQQRREQREAEAAQARRKAGAGKVGRGDKVRTYNWGQQRVTDHRSGFESRRLDDVIAGAASLDAIMESVKTWLSEQDVLALEEETSKA